MISWSLKRRVTYIAIVLALFAAVIGWFLFVGFYEPATCFDGSQNNLESGVDCGGGCEFLCPHEVAESVVLFSRSFEVSNDIYSAVAYVENPNFNIGNESVEYTFKFYDANNLLITERKGRTFIAAGQISPIFEGPIDTGGIEPARTVFEINDNDRWKYVKGVTGSPFIIKNKKLTNAGTLPRVDAQIENTSVDEYEDIEVVTVIFNAQENAIATSRTYIEKLPRKATESMVFTWPEPLESELEACTIPVDVALLIDVSGSMNNDGANPPQPLTDAKDAASDFVGGLTPVDRTGLITFATRSRLLETFTSNHNKIKSRINSIQILPEEELGSTNMGDAIKDAVRIFEIDTLRKENGKQIIILLTDGIANEPEDPGGEPYALEHARTAKGNGYTIYTIGIGEGVNAPFLRQLASPEITIDDEYFFRAATSKDLSGIYSNISDSICERGAAIIDIIPRITDKPALR